MTLSQKKNNDFFAYYCQTKTLLIQILVKDKVTHNRKNATILNNAEKYILNNTISRFDFSLKIPKLCLYIIDYRINPMRSLYRVFKKAEIFIDVLNLKAQI